MGDPVQRPVERRRV